MMVPSMHCSADELSGLGQDNGQVQLEMHIGCVALPQSRQYPSPPIVFGHCRWHNFLVSALCETSVRTLKEFLSLHSCKEAGRFCHHEACYAELLDCVTVSGRDALQQ